MAEPKRFIIFYSWQSDLPDSSNKTLIRHALRGAASAIEQSESGLIIEIDEATREASGSPNIPAMILSKITTADVFVCDITTINATQSSRKMPNPNVVFELGYAIAQVGWERAILLFNKEFGAFPDDLPFDFDRHRIADYSASAPPSPRQRKNLIELLRNAIIAVVRNNPKRPTNEESPEQRKRTRDIQKIIEVMSTLHIPTIDNHVMNCPRTITEEVFFFWEGFNAVMNSSLFHLYDQNLLDLFRRFHYAFRATISHGECYHQNFNGSGYILPILATFPYHQTKKLFGRTYRRPHILCTN